MTASSSEQVRRAFDRIAPIFDDVVVANPINAWMRQSNLACLRGTFPVGGRLLDLGCGTGADAIALAQEGSRIFGLDISEGMVSRAREKVAKEHLEDQVVIVPGRIRDLPELLRDSPWPPFDGAYANFSLTYEDDLPSVSRALWKILRPGASFVCTLPNRVVLSELLVYGPQLRFGNVLWRFRTPLRMDVHGSVLEIHTYSPWQVQRSFASEFELRRIVGIPSLLPPVYLHGPYRRLGGGGRLLETLDRHLAARFPCNRLGEHTLYEFHRRP